MDELSAELEAFLAAYVVKPAPKPPVVQKVVEDKSCVTKNADGTFEVNF